MSDTEEEVGLRDMEGKGKGETTLLVREMVSCNPASGSCPYLCGVFSVKG